MLTNVGDVRDEAFLVLSGKAVIDGSKYVTKGAVIGDVSFLSGRKRSSYVKTVDHLQLLVMSRIGFVKAMTMAPVSAFHEKI